MRRSCRKRRCKAEPPVVNQTVATPDIDCTDADKKKYNKKIKTEPLSSPIPIVCQSNPDAIDRVRKRAVKKEVIPDKTKSIANVKKVARKRLIKKEQSMRPTPEECLYATLSLGKLHPTVVDRNDDRRKTLLESCGQRDSVTDAIMSTMLSQNTTDANSKAAYKLLKKTFPTWEEVADADVSEIEQCIRVAGLAKTRAERMQAILQIVRSEKGTVSLDYVRDIACDEEIKKELGRFKGLGPKTISCVLLFALGRPEFPVDTHVLRISQKMGWVSASHTREGAYAHLNKMVPDDLKLDLHCLLVSHGKVCHRCAANGRPQFPPKNGAKLLCPLAKIDSKAGYAPLQTKISKKIKSES